MSFGSRTNWLCFFVPLILLAVQLVIEFTVSEEMHVRLHSENSPIETLQFILLMIGLFFAVKGLCLTKFQKPLLISIWLLVAALGCLYVGGEEVSWGQHFLNWNTPDYWAALNDQGETNFHNTSSWLDQKLRLLLELGVLVGGLLLPLYTLLRPQGLPLWLAAITPPSRLALIAGVALFVKLADKVGEATGFVLFRRASEVVEFYIFYFVMLYLAFLYAKIKSEKDLKQKEKIYV